MTRGIRAFAVEQFNKMLPQLERLGGTEFRRSVMEQIMKKFDTSMASAATNYNFAFKLAQENNPNAVIGLGRNPITAASAGRGSPRRVQNKMGNGDEGGSSGGGTGGRRASNKKGSRGGSGVTVVRESSGVVVAENLPRNKAKLMVENSGGRGRPRLIIQEDQE